MFGNSVEGKLIDYILGVLDIFSHKCLHSVQIENFVLFSEKSKTTVVLSFLPVFCILTRYKSHVSVRGNQMLY